MAITKPLRAEDPSDEVNGLQAPRVALGIYNFVSKLAANEAVDLNQLRTGSDSEADKVWNNAASVWEAAGGCPVSADTLKRLFQKGQPQSANAPA